jgi:hypothetical protein
VSSGSKEATLVALEVMTGMALARDRQRICGALAEDKEQPSHLSRRATPLIAGGFGRRDFRDPGEFRSGTESCRVLLEGELQLLLASDTVRVYSPGPIN